MFDECDNSADVVAGVAGSTRILLNEVVDDRPWKEAAAAAATAQLFLLLCDEKRRATITATVATADATDEVDGWRE